MKRAALVACAFFAVAASTHLLPTPAFADDVREVTAREYFAVGKYQAALDIYGRLYAETLHPTYVRNIGRCYQMMGEADRAITSFREYLRMTPGLESAKRAEIEGFIREMETLKAVREQPAKELAPAQRPAGTVTAPGPAVAAAELAAVSPPSPAAPAHESAAPPSGGSSRSTSAALVPPAAETSSAALPGKAPLSKRWWLWAAVGAAVVAGTVTALALGSGSSGGGRPACPPATVCPLD